jgi:SAM-dependent methyltransferase
MNAQEYYSRNVLLHGQGLAQIKPHDCTTLPRVPTETDYALYWLSKEGIRGGILDVGCAGLDLLIKSSQLFSHQNGVDIVSLPAWAAYPAIRTRTCNLDQGPLPYDDESFDAVTCLMVLEHVFDPYHGVRELRRVCKSNGRVVIGVPNIAGPKRRFELLAGKLPVTSARFSFSEDSWDGYHLHNFTKATLDWLLRREGLIPIRWAAQGKFRTLKRLRPSLFGNDLIVLARKTIPNPSLQFPF